MNKAGVNTKMFKSLMIMNGDTQAALAKDMGLPQSALSARINGKIEFRLNEMNFIRLRWNLSDEQVVDLFFAIEVSNKDTIEKGA